MLLSILREETAPASKVFWVSNLVKMCLCLSYLITSLGLWVRGPPWGDFVQLRGQNFGLDSQGQDRGSVGPPQRDFMKGLAAEIFKPWVRVPGLWGLCLGYPCLIVLFGRNWLIVVNYWMTAAKLYGSCFVSFCSGRPERKTFQNGECQQYTCSFNRKRKKGGKM